MTRVDEEGTPKVQVPWNERGVVVIQAEADFIHEASVDFWANLADRFGFDKSPFGRSGEIGAASFVTKVEEEGSLATLTGYFHPFTKEPHKGHCTVTLKRSPKKSEAEGEKATDLYESLGRMADGWEGDRAIDCSISASYLVKPSRWQPRFVLPRGRNLEIDGQRVVMRPDTASWQLDDGQVPPLSQVVVNVGSREEPIIIRGVGQQQVSFGRELLQEVDDAIWRALKNFLKPVSNE